MIHVVIVNGKPESGKTTFEQRCIKYLNDTEMAHGHIISSIDPIKAIYRKLGWDGKKTDEARKNLSILKKMWIDICNGPVSYIIDYVIKLSRDEDHVVFVDIREESEIEKLTDVLYALKVININYTTVLVNRPDNDGMEYGNKSDDMVGNNTSIYEHIIHNKYDINYLDTKAREFIDRLMD